MKFRAFLAILALAYPVTAHIAIASQSESLTIASLAVLGSLILLPGLAEGNRMAWLLVPAVIAGILLLSRTRSGSLPLYAPPVLITGFIAWTFARTLAPARTPLIERFVRLMHGPGEPIDVAIRDYARRLTGIWAALLTTLSTVNLTLALLAVPTGLLISLGIEPYMPVPQAVWSLFANVLNYVIVAVFFVGEHLYRRQRFPLEPYRNVFQFIRRVVALGPQILSEPDRLMNRSDQ